MPAMWRKDGNRWGVMPPTGFPDEATLHKIVEADPQLLADSSRVNAKQWDESTLRLLSDAYRHAVHPSGAVQ